MYPTAIFWWAIVCLGFNLMNGRFGSAWWCGVAAYLLVQLNPAWMA